MPQLPFAKVLLITQVGFENEHIVSKHFDATEIIISEKLMRKLIIMTSEQNTEETKYQVTAH